jgi:hypothetical protein
MRKLLMLSGIVGLLAVTAAPATADNATLAGPSSAPTRSAATARVRASASAVAYFYNYKYCNIGPGTFSSPGWSQCSIPCPSGYSVSGGGVWTQYSQEWVNQTFNFGARAWVGAVSNPTTSAGYFLVLVMCIQ